VRKLTIGIVGLGAVAEPHLLAYQRLGNAGVVAVADPRRARVRDISRQYQIAGFSSCEELLASTRPDIVCVLTPANTHREITEQCAAAGAHVLCEKPMAVTVADAEAMERACQAAGVEFFYGSSYRYLPALQAARQLIGAGAIGRVRLICEQVLGGRGACGYQAMAAIHYPIGGPGGGGYGLVDHGIHLLDIVPWLCDSRIASVMGRGDRTGARAQPEFALLRLESGVLASLLYDQNSWPAELPSHGLFSEGKQWIEDRGWVGECGEWDPRPGNIAVYGDEGALRIFYYANRLLVSGPQGVREERSPPATTPWHFGAQMQEFCSRLVCREPPACQAADGIRALRVLHAIYASESCGQWQDVGVV
jgi:UDP-N-acetyl-2-amino-2-deoxyglucuronate dehydrogenase